MINEYNNQQQGLSNDVHLEIFQLRQRLQNTVDTEYKFGTNIFSLQQQKRQLDIQIGRLEIDRLHNKTRRFEICNEIKVKYKILRDIKIEENKKEEIEEDDILNSTTDEYMLAFSQSSTPHRSWETVINISATATNTETLSSSSTNASNLVATANITETFSSTSTNATNLGATAKITETPGSSSTNATNPGATIKKTKTTTLPKRTRVEAQIKQAITNKEKFALKQEAVKDHMIANASKKAKLQ